MNIGAIVSLYIGSSILWQTKAVLGTINVTIPEPKIIIAFYTFDIRLSTWLCKQCIHTDTINSNIVTQSLN